MAMRGLIALSFPVGDNETTALLAALESVVEEGRPLFS